VNKPSHVVLKLLKLFFGGEIWKSFEKQVRKNSKHYKQREMGDSGGNSEVLNTKKNVYSEGQTHKVSERNGDSVGK
jgi:hypothetical protein